MVLSQRIGDAVRTGLRSAIMAASAIVNRGVFMNIDFELERDGSINLVPFVGCQVGLIETTSIALRIGFRRDGSDVDEWVQMVLPADEARELSRLIDSVAEEALKLPAPGQTNN